jgi:predicted DNA-binding transcriptional regulator AlpA
MSIKSQPLPRVLTLREWYESNGFSKQTAQRLIASGNGPKLTRLSPRRIGVRDDHAREWLDERIIESPRQSST